MPVELTIVIRFHVNFILGKVAQTDFFVVGLCLRVLVAPHAPKLFSHLGPSAEGSI